MLQLKINNATLFVVKADIVCKTTNDSDRNNNMSLFRQDAKKQQAINDLHNTYISTASTHTILYTQQ